MKLRRLKNGRIKDMDSGLIVSDKLAKSIMNGKPVPKLRKRKSTKRSDHKSKRHTPHAYKKWTIRFYSPNSNSDFGVNFGNRGATDEDLLYISYYFKAMADEDIKRDAKKYADRFND